MPKLPKINAKCINNFGDREGIFFVVMKNKVYNMNTILETHPGGINLLTRCRVEPKKHFDFHSTKAKKKWKTYAVGIISFEKECSGCLACKTSD